MKKKQFIAPLICVVELGNEALMKTGSIPFRDGDGGGPSAKRRKRTNGFLDEDDDEFDF